MSNSTLFSQSLLRRATCFRSTCLRPTKACFSSRANSWFTRFLTPKEEKDLYLGITSSFREKLNEQGTKSTQTYSHIIEHAIFSRPATASPSRLEEFKQAIDSAGKNIERLQQIENEMYTEQVKTTSMYNRLIRAYIASDALPLAEKVIHKFDSRGIFATTRTFTYMIQAYMKQGNLDKAKDLVEQMKSLSLLKLRYGFDCSVLLNFYIASGDSHALEFLWRDIMLHADTIKPGVGLYTQYLEYLISDKCHHTSLQEFVKEYLSRNDQASLNAQQYTVWIEAVQKMLSSLRDLTVTEHLLLHLIKHAPAKANMDSTRDIMQKMLVHYIDGGQDLKALTLYYRAQKIGAPDEIFEPRTLQRIEQVLNKVEHNASHQDHHILLAELAQQNHF